MTSLYLVGVSDLCGNQLQLDVVMETQTDSDLLLNGERLQTEEMMTERWRGSLQDIEEPGL